MTVSNVLFFFSVEHYKLQCERPIVFQKLYCMQDDICTVK